MSDQTEQMREVIMWAIDNLLPEGVDNATEWEARIAANLNRVAVKGKSMIGSSLEAGAGGSS